MEKSNKKNDRFYYLDDIRTSGKGSSQWKERIVKQFGDISRCVFPVETIQDISAYIDKLVEEFNANKRLKYKFVKREDIYALTVLGNSLCDIFLSVRQENSTDDLLLLHFYVIRNGIVLQVKPNQG